MRLLAASGALLLASPALAGLRGGPAEAQEAVGIPPGGGSQPGIQWPPRNTCSQYATQSECTQQGDACDWGCTTAGAPFDSHRCWPRGEGWGCGYYGGGRFCAVDGDWTCAPKWGGGPSNGCYCWVGYRGGKDCCPCPPVPHCAGREFITCGGDAYGGSVDHLYASVCSKCEDGFQPNENGTDCEPIASAGSCAVSPGLRQDCGFYNITEAECADRGCCWGGGPLPNPGHVPWCYHSQPDQASPP
mmetsp:Transcript_1405/g.4244  ORF Transcript_1405/g.4244 Transcript_1405/m.4244 type:complete len:245 (+) Transcript_1405:114-848(+)